MIELQQNSGVATIRYSNPPQGTIGNRGAAEFLAALDGVLADDSVHAVVVCGHGDVFIRHYHLASIEKTASALRSGAVNAEDIVDHPFARLTARIASSPKPVIAAINGVCMGGGFELALACDLRIANDDVRHIGLPEIKAGIFPGGGGTVRLPRLIGEARAREFILRGMVVDANTARDIGLVHELAPDAVALAVERAQEMVKRPAATLAQIKRLINLSIDTPLEDALRIESLSFYELLGKDDRAVEQLQKCIEDGIDLSELN